MRDQTKRQEWIALNEINSVLESVRWNGNVRLQTIFGWQNHLTGSGQHALGNGILALARISIKSHDNNELCTNYEFLRKSVEKKIRLHVVLYLFISESALVWRQLSHSFALTLFVSDRDALYLSPFHSRSLAHWNGLI